jgi:hypothetical protein
VSSRQEEKERRRREREEREQAEAGKAASKRRLQLVAGGVLGLVALGAVVAAIATSGGGGDSKADSGAAYGSAAIPARKISNFNQAVTASGCEFKSYPSEGRTHLPSDTAVNDKYKTNPPTSGNHRPTAAQDGAYEAGNSPAKENFVHTLEHGRIELQYSPKASTTVRNQMAALFNEKNKGVAGYHMMLFENNTDMPYEVAATAWTHIIGCKTVNDKTWDALRAFRDRFVDKGPEVIP